jgi:1-acyl-sn-glycerol-3-phosphate acyltransferase
VVAAAAWFLRRILGWRVQAELPVDVPPAGRPLVVVFNHTSNVDALLVAATVWRRLGHWARPLVKEELLELPVLGRLGRAAGGIPVSRSDDAGRDHAFDAAVRVLQRAGSILLAPEGTVTHDGRLLPLRHGAARLALEAGVDVLVVTHFGAQRAFSPVASGAERRVVVTMHMDVVSPWPDEDAAALTGRLAATLLDRSHELRATYPQADPDAAWWPPYASPSLPSETARANLERYRSSMTEAIANARRRMAAVAEEHEVADRLAQGREQARLAAERLAARSRARAESLARLARARLEASVEPPPPDRVAPPAPPRPADDAQEPA